MNSNIRNLACSLLLVCGASATLAAADDETIAVAPSLPAAPSEGVRAGKEGNGKRAQAALQQRMQQLDEKLQLTADQKEKIREIWTQEARAGNGSDPKDRRAALVRTRDEVRAVLTPDQQAKFDQMQSAGKAGKAGKADKAGKAAKKKAI